MGVGTGTNNSFHNEAEDEFETEMKLTLSDTTFGMLQKFKYRHTSKNIKIHIIAKISFLTGKKCYRLR